MTTVLRYRKMRCTLKYLGIYKDLDPSLQGCDAQVVKGGIKHYIMHSAARSANSP